MRDMSNYGMIEAKSSNLINIQLIHDGYLVQKTNSSADCTGIIIGSLICPPLSTLIGDFRHSLVTKLREVPKSFHFLTKNGGAISEADEGSIDLLAIINYDMITIQRNFEFSRLGVKWLNNEYIGFIFINCNRFLKEARETILSELADKFDNGVDFDFVDVNEWPVMRSQENKLVVWDICHENHFSIVKKLIKRKSEISSPKLKKRPSRLTDAPAKNAQKFEENGSSNSILISYVHGEASTHARDLKDELVNMGLKSVFLDVDDIPAGQDWQNIINTALNNCSAFVPLVTPRYGETRWTNREAKLADGKEKLIIPVSFLNTWPPDQLAIQFLSLQYIPWKTKEEFTNVNDHRANDISIWDPRSVHRVAKKIKQLTTDQDVSTPDSLSLLEPYQFIKNGSISQHETDSDAQKDLIVISAHSQQKSLVDNMMSNLKFGGYAVWSSIDMCEYNEETFSSFDDSQQSEYSFANVTASNHVNSQSMKHSDNSFSYRPDTKVYFTTSNPEVSSLKCSKSFFKEKVKQSKLVILVICEEYNKSRVCLQQAYYCEHRKIVIVVKVGSFLIDNVFLNLYPEQDMLKDDNFDDLFVKLKTIIAEKLKEFNNQESCRDHLQMQVAQLKKHLNTECCVYVIGGTNGVSREAESFCLVLGTELAKIGSLTLVTEGFFGIGDLVGKNFCEEREILAKGKPPSIYHVIPHRDDKNFEKKARQKADGSFEKIPYGKTIFCGDSVLERDNIVSSTFKMCILVEGGDRSAFLAEKFLWNDCTVIPLIFNNRSISSRHCLSESVSKVPCGLNSADWQALNKETSSPEERAQTVKKIVSTLLKCRIKAKS